MEVLPEQLFQLHRIEQEHGGGGAEAGLEDLSRIEPLVSKPM